MCADMEDKAFESYRDEVINSLNKYNVEYKLVGGTIVQLIDSSRKTADLDMLVRKSIENLGRFIRALADCGFATEADLRSQMVDFYGNQLGDTNQDASYDGYQLETSNPQWKANEFHIDMCFQLSGKFTYENSESETHTTSTGLRVNSVPFRYIAHMKANVFPKPRPRDIDDIKTIAKHLGLDPTTGEPIINSKLIHSKNKKNWEKEL